jgi:hypothetical protein
MPVFGPTDLVGGTAVRAEHFQDLCGPVGLGNRVAPDQEMISDLHIHRGTSLEIWDPIDHGSIVADKV